MEKQLNLDRTLPIYQINCFKDKLIELKEINWEEADNIIYDSIVKLTNGIYIMFMNLEEFSSFLKIQDAGGLLKIIKE